MFIMPIVPMRELLRNAIENGYAVGYFESWDQYSLEAVVEAAEDARSPVIIGFGGMMTDRDWMESGGLELFAAMGRTAAENSKIPVSFILNEIWSIEIALQGLELGMNAVMLDTGDMPLEDNIRLTRKLVKLAHAIGADVEGECGQLADASTETVNHTMFTNPLEAARYVQETGVDILSVAVGNVHILTKGHSSINFELLAEIHKATNVPLAIHGGTGFPDEAVETAINLGVAKFNVGTIMKKIYLENLHMAFQELPAGAKVHDIVGSRKATDIFENAKNAVKTEVIRRMHVYKSVGMG